MVQAEPCPTVYVVGAYIPNGGTWMAYHIGRILHEEWGYPMVVVRVDAETPDLGVFHYEPVFPVLPLDALEASITARDILVCNPSFSDHAFGLRLPPCRKISYVQDYKTFGLLDRFFDLYVSVGDFVQDFLRRTYDLPTEIIPPFISPPDVRSEAWDTRPAMSLVISSKGPPALLGPMEAKLRAILREKAPEAEAAIDWRGAVLQQDGKISHRAFCERLAQSRYCLSLTPAEGFGLIPLEAMALGAVVFGFDGFGGRHYFRRGRNSLVRPYPDLEGVADDLITLLGDDALGARLSAAGRDVAADYGYDRFRCAWVRYFTEILGPPLPRSESKRGQEIRIEALHHGCEGA
ncbi:glycosyltransferase [Nguyenibacter vanlangensis]|uniref:Glycosyltransferase family 4 protein n=1 Tax=Nguyenibacter vanlangensis TaxID=1216886 RepID=A0A7Y7ITR1_9PROT|nr:glycosyltransferase [Nguyenibacter vanlangensis]NVN10176.1 glycosyltransferase family 4 protein [Nguyenibacter vanlangensis]